ncbi:MAG: alpha-D-ribose 1-methylphosphonate 5-triphosphate diphosphatase [Caldilineaceae bacterium]|nr:alpha-D-ribose 1-methylphosphonate 5-triphosphate diphosphatase [Caldilineaceae bacterium]
MWLSDCRIVLPDGIMPRGSLRVEEGQIAEIVEGPAPRKRGGLRITAAGMTILPGLVDIHGDMLEREINPRPKASIPIDLALHELDKRLVATGITTAYAAVSFAWHKEDSIRSEERAREIMVTVNQLRPVLLADHYVHARFEITNPDAGKVLEELLMAEHIHLVSIMDHTPGQGQYRDIEAYVKFAVEWSKRTGENLDEAAVRARVARSQARPKSWDTVREIARLAHRHRVVLASHDDDTVEKVSLMDELGISISEFPVAYEAARSARECGIHVAMGAPNALQGRSLSGNLSAAEAIEAGLVDTLATDYYPASMLHAAFALVERGVMPLHEAIKLVSQNPADALNMTDRGAIAAGRRADLVFVETDGRPRVRGTLRGGVPVYWDSRMAQLSLLRRPNQEWEALAASD